MHCYRHQGRGAEAVTAYQRCRAALRSTLGVDPSRETESLLQTVLKEQSTSAEMGDGTNESARRPKDSLEDSRPEAPVNPAATRSHSNAAQEDERERRKATILALHLSAVSNSANDPDPEEMDKILAEVHTRLESVIREHGGIVNQFSGQEMLALFGIPRAHEDDALRAVLAAWRLHESADAMLAPLGASNGVTFGLGAGIDSGLVVSSHGDSRSGKYRTTGEASNRSIRLAARAAAGDVLVSAETRKLVAGFFDTVPLDEDTNNSEIAYRVLGRTGIATRFEAAGRQGYTPFTGRALELATLQACLDKTVAGHGQFVSVIGEAGVGKSRLLYEFKRTLDRNKITVLEGRCQAYGTTTPYLPLLDALRRGLQVQDEIDPSSLERKAVANIRAVGPELEPYIPLFLHLLSISSQEFPPPADLRGEALKSALEEALSAITTSNTRRQPMVEIFEDWQWADEASESALKNLLGVMAQFPLLVIVLSRPGRDLNLASGALHTPIALKNLESNESEAMASSHWQVGPLPKDLSRLIHDRTEGNPFYIEEVCRTLIEDGTVRVGGGRLILTRPVKDVRIPETVQAVIQTRVDRLDDNGRETLRLASVIGRQFSRRMLNELSTDPALLTVAIEGLKAAELIQQTRILPDAEYIFAHVLSQTVVYENLLMERRRQLHGRVGAAIETLHAGRLDEQFEALAHHYCHSYDSVKAIDYLQKAAEKAVRLFSYSEARRFFCEALRRIMSLRHTTDEQRIFIDIALKCAIVSLHAPTMEMVEWLDQAAIDATALGDRSSRNRLLYWGARLMLLLGQVNDARTRADRLMGAVRNTREEELYALSMLLAGRIAWLAGNWEAAADNMEKGALTISKFDQAEAQQSFGFAAWPRAQLGQFDRARAAVERHAKYGLAQNNDAIQTRANYYGNCVDFFQGCYPAVVASQEPISKSTSRVGEPILVSVTTGFSGYALTMLGHAERGLTMIEAGIEGIEEAGSTVTLTYMYGLLAEMLALAESKERCLRTAHKGLSLMRTGERYGESTLHRALAMGHALEPSDWHSVEKHMEICLRLCRERKEHPTEAVALFRFAEILHRRGINALANDRLNNAIALFADMQMAWWLEKALRFKELHDM